MSHCLFCNNCEISEENMDSGPLYVPVERPDFICSTCERLLAKAAESSLKMAYTKAVNFGYLSKAKALSFFIKDDDGRQTKPAKYHNRKRVMRAVRHEKRADRNVKKRKITALLKDKPVPAIVS